MNYELWRRTQQRAHTLTQEAGLGTAGLDISDPKKLTVLQWATLCAKMATFPFPKEFKPFVAKCSPNMDKIFQLVPQKCKLSSLPIDPKNQKQTALCQTVTGMVRFIGRCGVHTRQTTSSNY